MLTLPVSTIKTEKHMQGSAVKLELLSRCLNLMLTQLVLPHHHHIAKTHKLKHRRATKSTPV